MTNSNRNKYSLILYASFLALFVHLLFFFFFWGGGLTFHYFTEKNNNMHFYYIIQSTLGIADTLVHRPLSFIRRVSFVQVLGIYVIVLEKRSSFAPDINFEL